MLDVALATCRVLHEPDPDDAPLRAALTEVGIRFRPVAWDAPDGERFPARLTLLRSTWNYPLDPARFLEWAAAAAGSSRLCNSLPLVRWNLHKRYLLELERAGVPVAPTELVPRGSREPLAAIQDRREWREVVVKPAISAASYRTIRVDADDPERGERHLRALVADRDALVQRYLPSVEEYGERALVWIDGELTHAVRKSRRLSGDKEEVSAAPAVAPEERRLAGRAVAEVARAVGETPVYARVDVAPGPTGAPVVMELELIEPSLFFSFSSAALRRFVSAIARLLKPG